MKNKDLLSVCLVIIFCCCLFWMNTIFDEKSTKEVIYSGDDLKISIDGEKVTDLPNSGIYYLVSYNCDDVSTVITWDNSIYRLGISNKNKNANVSCDLEFKSKPFLYEMPVGSYVKYVGSGGMIGDTTVACKTNGSASSSVETDETEAPNSCSGQNAREDLDTSGYTYGYCYSANDKYYTTGWRIAYIDSNKPVIISAGSPECKIMTSSASNVKYIREANSLALKYCNIDYVDGNCTCIDDDSDSLCDSLSSDAWAINDTDFYNMTKSISGVGKRLTQGSSNLGDVGGMLGDILYCVENNSYQECGYNNDLVDNGGWYWFASMYNSSSGSSPSFTPVARGISYSSNPNAFGLRPMIRLSSSVYITGGSGTIDDPYTIARD